jgi:hypothetical protein
MLRAIIFAASVQAALQPAAPAREAAQRQPNAGVLADARLDGTFIALSVADAAGNLLQFFGR